MCERQSDGILKCLLKLVNADDKYVYIKDVDKGSYLNCDFTFMFMFLITMISNVLLFILFFSICLYKKKHLEKRVKNKFAKSLKLYLNPPYKV